MTDTLLVTSIQDSTGKTAVALALGLLARDRGRSVGYMKPKGTRLQSSVGKTLDRDPMLAREVLGLDAEMHQMEPIVYSPTFVEGAIRGQEDPEELAEIVREQYDRLSADADLMIVEGGGSYTTGGIVDLTDPDLAELLDARVLVVADYAQPTDLDDALAAVDGVRAAGTRSATVEGENGGGKADDGEDGDENADDGDEDRGDGDDPRSGSGPTDRLAGVLFNRVADAAYDQLETEVVPFLEGRGIETRGVVPRVRELAGVTVADLADELGAEVIAGETETDGFVERFLVGAMGGDAALRHFRRTKDAAVVTGGDRSEIHTAALEAPGVTCLVLTGGRRPPGAVLGKAEERGVPVLLVNADTRATVERVEAVVRGGRTRDAATVERMRDLLHDHADAGGLIGD